MVVDKDVGRVACLRDFEETAIRSVLRELRGDPMNSFPADVEANLLNCATTANYYGRRMGFESPDGILALATVCLVLGDRRTQFFENPFVERIMLDATLTPNRKLNRLVEVLIGTVSRSAVDLEQISLRHGQS